MRGIPKAKPQPTVLVAVGVDVQVTGDGTLRKVVARRVVPVFAAARTEKRTDEQLFFWVSGGEERESARARERGEGSP